VHQDAAQRVEPGTSILPSPGECLVHKADRLRSLPRVTEFRRIMQDENGAVRGGKALTSGLKMPIQNRHLTNPPVGKESIRRLGVRPVLASQRDCLTQSGCQLPD